MPCTSRCHICFSLRAVRSNTVELQDFRVDGWNPTNYLGWLEWKKRKDTVIHGTLWGHCWHTGYISGINTSHSWFWIFWSLNPWGQGQGEDLLLPFCQLNGCLDGESQQTRNFGKTNLPWSAARNAVYHVASLVAPCASPLLLLWSVLVAPEIPANPSMTKWLDPTFKTPFPGGLYISTLTGPRLSVNFNLLFSLLKNGRKCLPIQKRDFKDSPKKETPRIPTKDISRVSQGFTLLHADLQLLLPVLQAVPGDLQS